MKAAVALLLVSLAFSPSAFAQEKAAKKKPVAKKVQKKAAKKPEKKAAAASSGDWSSFSSSAERNLKADEAKRKARK